MAFTSVALTDPASGYTSTLMPRDGVTVTTLDVQPSVRAVSEERVGSSGQVDTTVWASAAAVTLSLILWQGNTGWMPEQMLDEVGPLLGPWLRPALVCSNDQWAQQRQLTVRFSSSVKPVDNPATLPVALSFTAPSGVWEGTDLVTATIPAFVAAAAGLGVSTLGLESDALLGVPVTPGAFTGEPVVTSPGNIRSQWTALLYGPCTGPKLANDTLGQAIEFGSTIVLNPGDFVALDSQQRTAYLNGDVTQSVLGAVSFSTTDWWMLQPGANDIRYYPASAGPGSAAVLSFRPAWMT